MDILFLTQFYWPEVRTAPLNLAALAEDLVIRGHRVTVVTSVPNHPFGRVYDGYRMKLFQWQKVKGVNILRLPLYPDHSLSGLRRALNYGSFAISALIIGTIKIRKIKVDVIFSYLPPLTIGIPAVFFSWFKKAPIIYWMTDLWPENLVAAGAGLKPGIVGMIRRMEGWVYRKAAIISVNSPGYIENLKSKGVPEEKLRLLTDWAEEKRFFPSEPQGELAREHGLYGKFNVVYGGNLGKVQGLEVVLEAAGKLLDLEDLQFVFIGDGTETPGLQASVQKRQLPNVRFIPRKEPGEIHKYFALAQVLFAHLEKKPVFKMQIPSKIIAYMACERPILCAIEGEAAKVVEQAGAGVTCPPQDADALASRVRLLHALPESELKAMGANGREAFLAFYTRKTQVERIEGFLSEARQGTTFKGNTYE